MEPGELIFIETSEADPASVLMEAVRREQANGYELLGGLIVGPSLRAGLAGDVHDYGSIGQWMVHSAQPGPRHEYKLVRAWQTSVLVEAVNALLGDGWEPLLQTVFYRGRWLQWMWRAEIHPEALAAGQALVERLSEPLVVSLDA